MPFPVPGAYHIDWCIGVGLLFHYIFPIFPLILHFLATFEGGYMDYNCVPNLQSCSTLLIIVAFMSLCFFSLKYLSLFLSPPGAFTYLLHKLSGIWLHDGSWSQTQCDIYRETWFSPKHEKVGAELCS